MKRFILALLFCLLPFTGYAYTVGESPVMLPPAYSVYAPQSAAADQGATSTAYVTLKNLVDSIGTGEIATIILSHSGATNTTTYNLTTDETVSSNIKLWMEPGAILDGAGTLTINGPFDASLTQCFGATITVTFGSGAVKEVYPEWWGALGDDSTDDQAAIQATIDSLDNEQTLGSPGNQIYKIGSALTISKRININFHNSIIHNTGADHALIIDGSGATAIRRIKVADFTICGVAGTGDGLRLINVHSSYFQNVHVPATGEASFCLLGSLLNSFVGCQANVNGIPIAGCINSKYGIYADIYGAIDSNSNTWIGFSAAGINTASGIGVYMKNANGNVFIGGSSERNTIGVKHEAGQFNSYHGFHMELNGTDYEGSHSDRDHISPRFTSTRIANNFMVFNTTADQVIRTYEEGIISMPLQDAIRAYKNTEQTIPNDQLVVILFDAESYDKQSTFDSSVVSGTADATEASKLHDADGGFTEAIEGATVWNTTNDTYTTVSNYVDSGELDLTDDIMADTETYKIFHSKFTAPYAGVYKIRASVLLKTFVADALVMLNIVKNTTSFQTKYIRLPTANSETITIEDQVELAANETLRVRIQQVSGAAKVLDDAAVISFLTIQKIL